LGEPAIQIVDVSKRYGARWAIARLTFTLEKGASLLLTGHNGSGKSTLLKLIATASAPTFGKLTILGQDAVDGREYIRRRVALLSHQSYLYEDLTAEQNIVLLARLLGVVDPLQSAKAVIERVGMTKRAQHAVRTFSAGMRKRVAIARLLLKRPEIALLDEPFGELDPEGIDVTEKFIRELTASGTTVVLATHLVEQGKTLTDKRLHLEEGRRLEAA
jgi:heme exporter protein A